MRKFIVMLMVVFLSTFGLSGCKLSTSQQQEKERDALMTRANNEVPIPHVHNFLARKAVAEYMKRMDVPNKLFYIYVVANNGVIIGYYVAKTQVVNICTFLAPTDKVDNSHTDHSILRKAPADDGLYYGAGACNVDYFFDANSNALIQLKGLNYFISDQPLNLETKAFHIKVIKSK